MKGKKKNIHRGQVLQAAVIKSNISIIKLAKLTGYSRGSYYNHILEANLGYHILQKYGKAIKHDFTADFPEIVTQSVEDPEETYGEPKTIGDAIRQRDAWKEKYYLLSDKYQKLLEEKLK